MNHTPGPWISDGHSIYGPQHTGSKHVNGRVLIAQVFLGSHRADPQLDGGSDSFGFSSNDDVNLITAAPDLLAACEFMARNAFFRKWDGDEKAFALLERALQKAGSEVTP